MTASTALIANHAFGGRRLSVFDDNMAQPRHRWYEFKEGFSSALVNDALAAAPSDRGRQLCVLDPFAGSGTTLVEAAVQGHRVTGLEVNPFMSFTAKAKCSAGEWPASWTRKLVERALLQSRHEVPSPIEGQSTFSEAPGLKKWLFNRSVLRGFHSLDSALKGRGGAYPALRLAAFASLMECCNARRDGKCLRYRKEWRELSLSSSQVREAFTRRASVVVNDLAEVTIKPGLVNVRTGDSRALLRTLTGQGFDLVVTSPPYLNSFDYSDVYRPEMFAGGFVSTNADLMRVRLQTLRSHVQAKWEEAPELGLESIRHVTREIGKSEGLWCRRIPMMVNAYFVDMKDVLEQCYRVVRPGGAMWMVVSTSAYAGVEVPVDQILAELGEMAGWDIKGIFVVRGLRASGQHWTYLESGARPPLRESLLVLQRPR